MTIHWVDCCTCFVFLLLVNKKSWSVSLLVPGSVGEQQKLSFEPSMHATCANSHSLEEACVARSSHTYSFCNNTSHSYESQTPQLCLYQREQSQFHQLPVGSSGLQWWQVHGWWLSSVDDWLLMQTPTCTVAEHWKHGNSVRNLNLNIAMNRHRGLLPPVYDSLTRTHPPPDTHLCR